MPSSQQTISRRAFIQLGAAACSAGLAAAANVKKKKVLVGAHPWVYAATQPDRDITPVLEQIFADMRYAGMEAIELMHTALRPQGSVDRIRRLSDKYRLPVLGMSFSGNMWDRRQHAEVLADAEVVVSRLAQVGGRTLGTSVGAAGHVKTPDELDAQAELLRRLIALADSHGIVLNLHNHTYEVENNLHDLAGTLERIPSVKLDPDLNWLLRGGVEPVEFIRRFKKQIVFLHLRDQKADGTWSEAMGEGDMDYAAIAAALREINFQGDAVIELAHSAGFKPTRPLRESLKMSRDFVRQTFGW